MVFFISPFVGGINVHYVHLFHRVILALLWADEGCVTCIPVFEIFIHTRTMRLYGLVIPPWNSIYRLPLDLLLPFSCSTSILIYPSRSTFVLKLLLHEQTKTLVISRPYTITEYRSVLPLLYVRVCRDRHPFQKTEIPWGEPSFRPALAARAPLSSLYLISDAKSKLGKEQISILDHRDGTEAISKKAFS